MHVFLHVAIAIDGCNFVGVHNFLAHKLEAKILSLVSAHSHAHRFGLLLYCNRFVQYGVRNCESTLMQLWKCLLFQPFDRLVWPCIRLH